MENEMSKIFELATKITNPFSLVAFAIVAILFVVLRVSPMEVPNLVWISMVLIVLVAILAPVVLELSSSRAMYRVRVTVIGPHQIPVDEAKVWSSIGGEAKRVSGGWQFDIPAASKPKDGKLTIFASKDSAFLKGRQELQLENDFNPTITIQVTKEALASIRGIVLDEAGKGIEGARVSVAGHAEDEVTTKKDGNFLLPAHAAENEQVLLHVEKEGYQAVNQYHPSGDEPATIVLTRE
jgi:hypothetical protein